MDKIKSKKRIILKGFATLFYTLSVICICAGIVGIKSIQNNSFENKKLVNNNLDKTVSSKELMTSYQKINKMIQEKIKAKEAAKAKEKAKEEALQYVSSVSYTKSEYLTYAYDLVLNTYGWTEDDYYALVKLWNRESGWNANAHNSLGAHGIPQAYPASKMSSEGSDYYTNGKTQIRWGLGYIKRAYSTPSNAWAHFQSSGSY